MNLLITPALQLSDVQKQNLESEHDLYFLEDERIPLKNQHLNFDPKSIDGIVCNFFFQNNSVSMLPRLKFIQLTSAGFDRIPLEEMQEKNIKVYNAGATYAIPMAEWTVGKILEIYKHTWNFYENQKKCIWEKNRSLYELAGDTAVILGFGNVGKEVARRLKAFDVTVIGIDVVQDESGTADEWFPVSKIKQVLCRADIVVLTLPLTTETYHIINSEMLDIMKDSAVLINVARGGLIDEKALLKVLADGKFRGVALDVFEEEPLESDSPFWKSDKVILSPHNSFVGERNQDRLFATLKKNLMDQII